MQESVFLLHVSGNTNTDVLLWRNSALRKTRACRTCLTFDHETERRQRMPAGTDATRCRLSSLRASTESGLVKVSSKEMISPHPEKEGKKVDLKSKPCQSRLVRLCLGWPVPLSQGRKTTSYTDSQYWRIKHPCSFQLWIMVVFSIRFKHKGKKTRNNKNEYGEKERKKIVFGNTHNS